MDGESLLRPGYRFDRYELLCPVASGGMAAVWLARLRGKREFEKLYAIKTIKTELGDDARFQEMFLDEARLASAIEHPNVAHILDLGEQDGILYIVMEFVDGEALAKIARQARKVDVPLPLAMSLRIVADACAGLHAAHELKDRSGQNLGVVHRDVSPQNILVATNGAVKIIDFGVAKASNRRAGETGEGIVKGKIRFMAPEQVRAQKLDRRVDIWAMGVCLHELATGKLPFDSDSDIDVVRRLISDEAVPGFDEVPAPVAEILAHSLVRDPNERFSSAAAMRRAIENAMVQLHVQCSSEDVAEFVQLNLPEFAEKRHTVITKAMNDADRRGGPSSSLLSGGEVEPYAPTVVSQRGTSVEERVTRPDPVALSTSTSRSSSSSKVSARALLEGRVPADETVGGAFTDEEMAAIPKRRGALWFSLTVVALAAGAWFGYPGSARIRALVHRVSTSEPAAPVPPDMVTATASPSVTASAPPLAVTPSATASVIELPEPVKSAAADAAAAPTARPHSTSNDVTFSSPPSLPATATATATAPVTATATATEPPPPPPPPPPTATATSTPAPETNAPY